jgi:DNA-binding LacI/PurR family transcriptional regulator
VGFDDIEQASWGSYELTTFAQPVDEIALETVGWLSAPPKPDFSAGALLKLHAGMIWRKTVRPG